METFKYPYELRYFLPQAVIRDEPDYLMLFHPAGSPVWSGKTQQIHRGNNNALDILYPDRDYNVVVFWRANWAFADYYVNIALPMEWDGEVCRYLDLDLDVLLVTEKSARVLEGVVEPGVYELDRDEYDERRVALNYPVALMERTERALQTVMAHIKERSFPFDDSLLDWRPPAELAFLADLPDSAAMWHLEDGGNRTQ